MTVFDWQIICAALYVIGAFTFESMIRVMAVKKEVPVSKLAYAIAATVWPIIMLIVICGVGLRKVSK